MSERFDSLLRAMASGETPKGSGPIAERDPDSRTTRHKRGDTPKG